MLISLTPWLIQYLVELFEIHFSNFTIKENKEKLIESKAISDEKLLPEQKKTGQ